jgi:hypothetical protein
MTNDYKKDAGKPPVLDALLPFYPALEALAAMMVDAAKAHKIEGATDPFNEWRQLPQAKKRLANAAARHLLKGPWKQDDVLPHPHAVLALFNLLASITIHAEDNAAHCCTAPDSRPVRPAERTQTRSPLHGPAGADWRETTEAMCICGHPRRLHYAGGGTYGKCLTCPEVGNHSAPCSCPVYREE